LWKGKKRIEEQIILKYEINQINYFFCLFLRLISTYLQKIKTEMAAKDKYHTQVRHALEKDGWTITHDPYFLKLEGVNYPVDLGAEKLLAAQKENSKILVEVKSFLSESIPNEFHTALGQYLDYELGLEELDPERAIFLAIPEKIYQKIQKIPILLKALKRYTVKVLIFDSTSEEIKAWLQE